MAMKVAFARAISALQFSSSPVDLGLYMSSFYDVILLRSSQIASNEMFRFVLALDCIVNKCVLMPVLDIPNVFTITNMPPNEIDSVFSRLLS